MSATQCSCQLYNYYPLSTHTPHLGRGGRLHKPLERHFMGSQRRLFKLFFTHSPWPPFRIDPPSVESVHRCQYYSYICLRRRPRRRRSQQERAFESSRTPSLDFSSLVRERLPHRPPCPLCPPQTPGHPSFAHPEINRLA